MAKWNGYILLITFFSSAAIAQQDRTVGLLQYDKQHSYEGYNLFFPRGAGHVYLMNNCGEIVHRWVDTSDTGPNQSAYLQRDGSIFIAKGKEPGEQIQFGTCTEKIEHRDWDNNLLWSFTYSDSLVKAHHDFKVLPNGNILVIAWELKSGEEAIAAGIDSARLQSGRLISEQIVEVKPTGKLSGEIVWKWSAWDHLVQEHDSIRGNFGKVKEHPEKINLNYCSYSTKDDWLHFNAIDYHAGYDLLLVSVSAYNELWLIDHSTTTTQAASAQGGNWGRGGDILWRWGNPEAYHQGDSMDKKLFFPHNAHWACNEPAAARPNLKEIYVFNNFYPDSCSSVISIIPEIKLGIRAFAQIDNQFLPAKENWQFTTVQKGRMFSSVGSSAQMLPNNNLLICAGKRGYFFESTPEGEIVWEYRVPTKMGKPVQQGDTLNESDNRTFHLVRYPLDWITQDLSEFGALELNADTAFCGGLHYVNNGNKRIGIYAYWNEDSRLLHLRSLESGREIEFEILQSDGNVIAKNIFSGYSKIDLSGAPADELQLLIFKRNIYTFNNK